MRYRAGLEACEGAVLLVDAAQGIEAQTLANLYLAINADLKIIPVLNKIDLPAAQPERYAEELVRHHRLRPGRGARGLREDRHGRRGAARHHRRPGPAAGGRPGRAARALIFDSVYDTYRGVVTYVRVVDGKFNRRERMLMMSTQAVHETLELGVISPEPIPSDGLGAGEVGYVISGVKDVRQARVGDTITTTTNKASRRWRLRSPQAHGLLRPLSCRRRRVPSCGKPWTSSSSTTPPWSTSRRRPPRSASGSAAGSSACCTWRSSGSGLSASST